MRSKTLFHLSMLVFAARFVLTDVGDFSNAFAQERPNVLIVLTDDQGFGDVTSHGNRWIKTPQHDRLAAEGVRFDRFFVSPVCAPTRASLLTGRWHLRTGVHGVTRGYESMRSSEVTIAELFRDAGYATGAFGKWHNGAHFPEHPRGQGFEQFYGFCAGHFNNYFNSKLEDNGSLVPFEGYMIDRLTDRAIQFIEQQQAKPWLCYVAYNTPHSPWQVDDEYWDRYANNDELPDDKARCAYAMVENIDDNLGRLFETLSANQIDRNTIVVFLTDNGANSARYNAEMRGRKGSVHEGGSRVPCFIRWPGKIPAGKTVKPIAAHIDLLPTLCSLSNVDVPDSLALDGVDLTPLFAEGGNRQWPARTLFTHWGDQAGLPRRDRGAVRTDRWRAVQENGEWQLYDMAADPGQASNVAGQQTQVLSRLTIAFDQWLDEVTVGGFERIPVQVGGAQADVVHLPGHEAELSSPNGKGIGYSGRAGWANDWVTRWTDPQATAAWPINVVQPGNYQIVIHYAASPDQAKNVIDVSVGEQSVRRRIETPHVPQVIASPDRVRRIEVYEQTWAPLNLGTIAMARGPNSLVIRAVELHTDDLVDIKQVDIVRVD